MLLNDGPTPLVSGSGNTAKAPVNAFTIDAFEDHGTLTYTGATKTFNGTVTCTKVVGNAATIVAVDADADRGNRTMVQDNGPSGDKAVNTMIEFSELSPKTRAKFLTCVDPDTAKLDASPPRSGDAIQIGGSPAT